MAIQQISIFLENKPGRLSWVTSTLSKEGLGIKAMFLSDTTDFGVLHLIADNTEKAMSVLKDQDFTVCVTEVLVVELKNNIKDMDRVLRVVHRAGLNIEYMYTFSAQNTNGTLLALRFDHLDKAKEALLNEGILLVNNML